ncbi:glycosyltransferase family 39 protein [Pseudonocardia sp. S2-4]|uniref:Glycosyltransferase family 39 protein n=2 Tax=Pseudonocardia humida TaxID=2800819 RepID=A0ABT1A962_9PSEU|nr:glycosyltransferase family 39 protein [Pseudonocardia humida]
MGLRVVATLCGVGTALLVALIARELVGPVGGSPGVSAARLHAGRTGGQPEYDQVRGLPAGTPSEKPDPPIPQTNLRPRPPDGGRAAQVLAAAATALGTFVLVVTHMVSTTSIDLVVWTALALVLLRLTRTGDGRWWVPAGLLAGIGLQNKWLVLLLCAGWAVALAIVGPRRVLRSGWLLVGVLAALAVAAPSLVWQAANGWPQLDLASGISESDGGENRVLLVPMQVAFLSPVLVPTLVAGVRRVWREPGLRWARASVLVYPVVAVVALVLGGKPYYVVPPAFVLLAAGAEPTVRWLAGGAARRAWAAVAAGVGVAVSAVVGLPVLPAAQLGPVLAMNQEAGEQVGWPELADTVATAWSALPADERASAVLFTSNYGQAGALDHYGPERGLPPAHSGHMSYADWGPPPDTATGPVLVVGEAAARFTGCAPVATHRSPDGVDNDEDGTVVSRCAAPPSWSRAWPALRHGY